MFSTLYPLSKDSQILAICRLGFFWDICWIQIFMLNRPWRTFLPGILLFSFKNPLIFLASVPFCGNYFYIFSVNLFKTCCLLMSLGTPCLCKWIEIFLFTFFHVVDSFINLIFKSLFSGWGILFYLISGFGRQLYTSSRFLAFLCILYGPPRWTNSLVTVNTYDM